MSHLGGRLLGLGRDEEARVAVNEAVEVYRRMAGANRLRLTPTSPNRWTISASGCQNWGETTKPWPPPRGRRDVPGAGRGKPGWVRPRTRQSLSYLGIRLSGLGRDEEARVAVTESVEIYPRMAVANPAALDPDLAGSLSLLGIRLSELGREEESLAATSEAVEIRRLLEEANASVVRSPSK